jgi:hypothetical protein
MPVPRQGLELLEFGEYSGTSGIISALGKMPVLRPYAKLKLLGDGVDKPFVIDDVQDPETEKFMYLRSFEYSLMPGPEQVKVSLFDDNGHVREVLTNVYNSIEANRNPGVGGNTFMDFEFGWADFSDSILGIFPVQRNISSAKHRLQIMNVEISYEEGGVAYQIVGFDTMTHMQGIIAKTTFPQCDVRDAISQVLALHKLKPPVFGNGGSLDSGPKRRIQDWRTDGHDVLQIVKEWLKEADSTSRRGRPLYVWWNSIDNRLHISDVAKAGILSEIMAADLAGPHQVNYLDPNETATGGSSIVIKFRPKVSGIHQLKSVAQASYADGDERKIAETLFLPGRPSEASISLGGDETKTGRGIPIHMPTGERLRATPDLEKNIGFAQYADSVNRALGVNTPGAMNCMAEMDCIGWPRADSYVQYINRLMQVIVRAPYGLNHYDSGNDDFTWRSKGIDLMLSGYYIIKRLTHVIDDNGYRMRIELSRMSGPSDPPLSPVAGNGGAVR